MNGLAGWPHGSEAAQSDYTTGIAKLVAVVASGTAASGQRSDCSGLCSVGHLDGTASGFDDVPVECAFAQDLSGMRMGRALA